MRAQTGVEKLRALWRFAIRCSPLFFILLIQSPSINANSIGTNETAIPRLSSSECKRISISDLVWLLRYRLAIKVHFIEASYGSQDAQTQKERYEEIATIAPQDRTEAEINFMECVSDPSFDRLVIGPKYQRETLNPDDFTTAASPRPEHIGRIIETTYTGYRVSFLNDSWLIEPKASQSISSTVSLKLDNSEMAPALDALQREVLKPFGIHIGFVASAFNKDRGGRISLDIRNTNLLICLAQFSEALGPDMICTIRGQNGFRKLQFNRINRR